MSLGYEVLRFIDRVRRQPDAGTDPRLLARLETYAKEAFEGMVALTAPKSPMTWEVSTLFDGTLQSSNRIPFRFPRPVEIVGFYSSIVVLATGGATTPTLDDIAVQIDTDSQNYLTSGDGIATPAGGTAGPFVTLGAMQIQVPRVVCYKLRNPTPDVGFTFRWKQATSVGAPVYKDVFLSMAMYAGYL